MKYCTKCVTPDTRPRLEFDESGTCNACLWHQKKQTEINWEAKQDELARICDRFRKRDSFDCICPCSGGKDGSYVALRLRDDFGMHPLCVTFAPPLPTDIGKKNLEAFKQSGFDHLYISPNPKLYRRMCHDFFLKQGRPKWPFVMGIASAILQVANRFDISLIIYGEQGEIEYGGKQATETLKKIDRDYLINIYWEGNDPSEYGSWWRLISNLGDKYVTWWSLFEDWNPEHHAKIAFERCGFEGLPYDSIGTFTNYAQLDDKLQDLHAYMMFVKFGFGRCTSDASIAIRRGAITREEGVRLVNQLDGIFPLEYLDTYCDYLGVTEKQFWETVDKYVNYSILCKTNNSNKPYQLKEKCI